MARTNFVVRYDFRAPGATPAQRSELFRRAVEQAAYAEQHGQQALMLSEHHVSADGYLPSPIPVAAAFAAVTSTIPISVAALLVNLYDPIRLAEEIAVLDHLSAGRVNYTLGLGYRREEYDLFGAAWESRGPDIEDRIQQMLAAWADGTVTPGPFSQPHPMLFYGGGSTMAAKRAARLGLHFQPQVGGPRAQGDLRGRVPLARPRPGLHAARARGTRERVLRRGPRPLLGGVRPLPAGRRPGVRRLARRPTRRRTSATTRPRSRRCAPRASTSCTRRPT